ncbi:MAG TPA: hypothetical protein VK469_15165 [Candidatus Kapabacteria bacterium]|nr:hypothetical protein [Candidatus Kapabacteria bacterium]
MVVDKSKKNTNIRAKVTGITLNIVNPDGTTGIVTLDPNITTCLFWNDESVYKILAPFYDSTQSEMTKHEFIKRFGQEYQEVIKDEKDPFKVTGDIIKRIWKHSHSKGMRAMMIKTTDCLPG